MYWEVTLTNGTVENFEQNCNFVDHSNVEKNGFVKFYNKMEGGNICLGLIHPSQILKINLRDYYTKQGVDENK